MSKIVNPSTIKKKPLKVLRDQDAPKSHWIEHYRDLATWRLQPVPEAIIERIAQELTEWSKKEDSLRLQDFYWEKDICDETYYDWVKKFPVLNFAHRKAKNALASRREKGMLSKNMPEAGVLKSLYKYDSLYAEIRADEKQDKIDIAVAVKAAQDNSSGTVNVFMEPFTDHTVKIQAEDLND